MARAEESGRKPRSGGAVRLALGSRELDLVAALMRQQSEQSAI